MKNLAQVILARPMRLLRVPEAFDHPEFIYELKLDGFRALAYVDGGQSHLVFRNGHEFSRWQPLKAGIARSVRCRSAVLDGEIVCFDLDGRPDFYALLFRAYSAALLRVRRVAD